MLFLEHVGICASNTVALKDWYIQLFGFKVVYDNQKAMPTYFLLMEDDSMLEIYPMDSAVAPESNKHQGIRHIAFGTDQIEKEYQKLLDNGVEIIAPLAEKNGVKTCFFRDLEGNVLHYIQRTKSLY